ncbi:MAG TPA: NF038122 family metalloprotease [Acetobacteraceae bacterium]|nr:NF038122 family metalloprotease [Acetobacteraceae bacterium]
MLRPNRDRVARLAGMSALACIALLAATRANALVIDAGFGSSITAAANAGAIETAIDTAVNAIGSLYSNPGTVSILFTTGPGGFLGQSNEGLDGVSYSNYTSLLAADAAAHPANTTLAAAVANLAYGNDANGSRPIAATTALLRVGLGVTGATPCFNASGAFVSTCGQAYDGVVTLSSTQTLDDTRPVGSGYDAIRVVEHEVDEVLGGGGAGSTLNVIAGYGLDNSSRPLTYYDGPLDLYRYSAPLRPSFSTSSGATAYLSVDGGNTNIVGFNQNPNGDFADFLSTGCPARVQDAFTCAGQAANETVASPEYQMMQAIGYNPVNEPASLTLLGMAVGGLTLVRHRARRPGSTSGRCANQRGAFPPLRSVSL